MTMPGIRRCWFVAASVLAACDSPHQPTAGSQPVRGFWADPPWFCARAATGDIDGDGDLDVCFGGALYRNLGGGYFQLLPMALPATRSAAFGDVDNDGDLDLLVEWDAPHLWLNDGTGRFTDATSTRVPAGIHHVGDIALGDLDGDGDLDAVVGDSIGADHVLRNDNGYFVDATATWLPGGSRTTRDLLLADFDGDGDLDLLTDDGARFWRNSGSSFAPDTSVILPATHLPVLRAGDVDGDGDLDLVIANYMLQYGPPAFALLLNDGTGHFLDASSSLPGNTNIDIELAGVGLGDVDGDGDLDLVFPQTGRLLRNRGHGQFDLAPDGTFPALYCHATLCLFDADRDGDLDVAAAATGSTDCLAPAPPRLLLNDGNGGFTLLPWATARLDDSPGAEPESAATGTTSEPELRIGDARIGHPLTLTVTAVPTSPAEGQLTFVLLGLERAAVPVAVPPFGELQLAAASTVALPMASSPASAPGLTTSVPIPASAVLATAAVHAQALVFDPSTGRGRFTNLAVAAIVR